jgi:hypothetical protein
MRIMRLMALGLGLTGSAMGMEPEKPSGAVGVVVPTTAPAAGGVVRLVGGEEIAVREEKGSFFFGDGMAVTTPLPVGYPQPTPVGAIEMKTYPSVRRAEVSGRLNPAVGMTMGFFPLFQHIKRRDIAMTSPVEMDYRGWEVTADESNGGPSGWTMSFLYRKPEQGPTGKDAANEDVQVVDTAEVTVIAVGLRGGYGLGMIRRGVQALHKWVDAQDEWEIAGEPRAFYYNGPDTWDKDKWAEAQLPVRRVGVVKAEEGKGELKVEGKASRAEE